MLLLKLKINTLLSTVFIFLLNQPISLANSPFTMNGQTLSDSEAAGQLLMIGVSHSKVSAENSELFRRIPAGSIILFKRNIQSIAQLSELTQSLQKLNPPERPFIIGVDQEGGDVVRVQTKPPLPSAFSISESKSLPFISVFSNRLSEMLWASGINMNFSPVLDLANPEQKSFLGSRSFGNDPHWVARVGHAYSRQHILNYVIPVAKHFPGIGNAIVDPHKQEGIISKDFNSLEAEDLIPFRSFAKLGRFSGVMLSHFIYPSIDPKYPASLSKKVIDHLRVNLNFQGLVITDDLQMDAVKMNTSLEDAAIQSLKAGSDIIMIAYSQRAQQKVFERILSAIRTGEINRKDVQDKINRIGFVKTLISKGLHADAQLKISLNDFYDLDEKLLDFKIDKQKRKISSSGYKKVCLLSNHKEFNRNFLSSFQAKVSDLSPQISHRPSNKLITQLSFCERTILTVFNERSRDFVQGLPRSILQESYIVNLGLPSLAVKLKDYAVIQLDFPHQLAGKKIAQLID